MSQGLEIYDASGNVVLSVSDRITRVLGSITVNATGSITDAGFAGGTPFFCVYDITNVTFQYIPAITISGNTMTYTFTSGKSNNCLIIYGTY